VGYTLCTGSSFFRRCDAVGQWSAPEDNPYPSGQTCDVGGGAGSGFRAAATCTSGLDAVDPGFASTCASCFPYRANGSGCLARCGGNNLNCWTGHHCSSHAADTCVSDANGSSCDEDGDCTTGRCTATFICAEKLADGGSCGKNSDCTSGWCNGTVCASKKANTVQCAADVECLSGHCSNDFDTLAATGYCAPAGTCMRNGSSFLEGWAQCNAGAADSTYARSCYGGTWSAAGAFAPGACSVAGLGGNAGYMIRTCATGQNAGGLGYLCQSCGGWGPNPTYDACRVTCSGVGDQGCADASYCNGSSACVPDLANGAGCSRDTMCASGRCEPEGCLARAGYGEFCDEDSDCQTGFCDIDYCENWYR
jgi:hypothetical protein